MCEVCEGSGVVTVARVERSAADFVAWAYVEAHDANVVPTGLLRKFAAALLAAAEYAEKESE